MIGYAQHIVAYIFLVIKSEVDGIDANTIVEFTDATFFEDVFTMKDRLPLTPEPRPSIKQSPPKEGDKHVNLEGVRDLEENLTMVKISLLRRRRPHHLRSRHVFQ